MTSTQCVQPASVTAPKHARPSLITAVPGAKSDRAQIEIASLVKPDTCVTLTYNGRPCSLSETAATMGTLFSDPRPDLPPARSLPR